MHFLSGVRFYGFTVFGFWMPIIFWFCYAVLCMWNVLRSKRGGGAAAFFRDAILMGVIGFLMTAFIVNGSVAGLCDIADFTAIPAYFLLFRKQVGYMQIAGITYLSTLVSDLVGIPFVSDVVGSHFTGNIHSGWLPQLILTHPYHLLSADYHCIGGAGLLDGLLIYPMKAAIVVFLVRVLWMYIYTDKEDRKAVWYNITGRCSDIAL